MYRIRQSKDGQFYAVEHARNGEPLATTEMLKKHSSVLTNIYSQMRNHGSSRPQKVFDYISRQTYNLKLNGRKIERFNIKRLPHNAK